MTERRDDDGEAGMVMEPVVIREGEAGYPARLRARLGEAAPGAVAGADWGGAAGGGVGVWGGDTAGDGGVGAAAE
ncbi:MAG: hypothetical protein HYV26_02390 [Candidatus Hydrogenedentes bacterium]|nr:hypothetical protein [Candidatus Hydrogenedentota bacterium]